MQVQACCEDVGHISACAGCVCDRWQCCACRSKFAVKELQGLPRILDTLAYAFEFIMMPTPSEQAQGLEELRRSILRSYPELKVPPSHLAKMPAHSVIPEAWINWAGAPYAIIQKSSVCDSCACCDR